MPDSRMLALASSWRGKAVDVELVTRLYREDGSNVEIINERRVVVKQTTRRGNVLSLDMSDLDRSALTGLYPSLTYTVADWPELYADHVNRPVPDGVGTILKVPLTYLVKTGGTFKYGACKVTGVTPTILTVYRDGQIVAAVEYGTATQVVAGITHLLVTWAKEQTEQSGRPYDLTADILFPGSRLAADEAKRILLAYGATIDESSFAAAALYHNDQGLVVDAGYVTPITGNAIIEDLCFVGRGQLRKTPAGAYAYIVDRPRDVKLSVAETADQVRVDDFSYPEIPKKVTLAYRPRAGNSEGEKDLLGTLSRSTTGAGDEKRLRCAYIRSHAVADKVMSYVTKLAQNRAIARARMYGVQLTPGDLMALEAASAWSGVKTFAAPAIARPVDANEMTLREYVEDTYVYTPGTLPADATNGYTPDYSQTLPLAPTGLAVVSQGTSSDTDGKTTAYALIRATPPAVNWSRLIALITDTTTNEVHQAQLVFSGGNYEARIPELRPNRAHTVVAWAVNATNVDGIATAAVGFTSANYTTAPSAPGSCSVQQQSPRSNFVLWAAVADPADAPKIRRYVVFKKIGAGSFTEMLRTDATHWIDDNIDLDGTQYQYKVRAEDINGNESSDSSTATITPVKKIDDGYTVGQGLSGASIANASINRGRGDTGTASSSGTINNGFSTYVTMDVYTFFPAQWVGGSGPNCFMLPYSTDPGNDQGTFGWYNNTGSNQSWGVRYRKFNA